MDTSNLKNRRYSSESDLIKWQKEIKGRSLMPFKPIMEHELEPDEDDEDFQPFRRRAWTVSESDRPTNRNQAGDEPRKRSSTFTNYDKRKKKGSNFKDWFRGLKDVKSNLTGSTKSLSESNTSLHSEPDDKIPKPTGFLVVREGPDGYYLVKRDLTKEIYGDIQLEGYDDINAKRTVTQTRSLGDTDQTEDEAATSRYSRSVRTRAIDHSKSKQHASRTRSLQSGTKYSNEHQTRSRNTKIQTVPRQIGSPLLKTPGYNDEQLIRPRENHSESCKSDRQHEPTFEDQTDSQKEFDHAEDEALNCQSIHSMTVRLRNLHGNPQDVQEHPTRFRNTGVSQHIRSVHRDSGYLDDHSVRSRPRSWTVTGTERTMKKLRKKSRQRQFKYNQDREFPHRIIPRSDMTDSHGQCTGKSDPDIDIIHKHDQNITSAAKPDSHRAANQDQNFLREMHQDTYSGHKEMQECNTPLHTETKLKQSAKYPRNAESRCRQKHLGQKHTDETHSNTHNSPYSYDSDTVHDKDPESNEPKQGINNSLDVQTTGLLQEEFHGISRMGHSCTEGAGKCIVYILLMAWFRFHFYVICGAISTVDVRSYRCVHFYVICGGKSTVDVRSYRCVYINAVYNVFSSDKDTCCCHYEKY